MVIKNGRYGKFAACPGYPDCKNTKPLAPDGSIVVSETEKTDVKCDLCGSEMILKTGRYGNFLACSKYPECKNTKKILKETGVLCPLCGGKIVTKKSKKSIFYSCENYKICKFSSWDLPVDEKCPSCGEMLFSKKGKNQIVCHNKECGYKRISEPKELMKIYPIIQLIPAILKKMKTINVIGAGLAGCEAAYQAAKRGVRVFLYEMKPKKFSPAHKSPLFAELVCSNSLRSNQITNAVGLLKAEMRILDSITLEAALASEVPAGSALAVDRNNFSGYITDKLSKHPDIEIIHDEVTSFDENNITIIATGPLTSPAFSEYISQYIGVGQLYFYDAAAPVISASTINTDRVFYASRYNKGEASYLNCPMTEAEYGAFYHALINARQAPLKEFENDPKVFEGCMPIEIMAKRGYETLRYGPLKPVGLINPRDGHEAYAVVQLRQENVGRTMYNLVGFQTHLVFEEQRRVFGLIPGLEKAEFLRYGVMHRNTFIDSPKLLNVFYSLRKNPNIFFAGQITGVEGYVESASSGIAAGINAARWVMGQDLLDFTDITVIGALANYISNPNITQFQPMNANFGIVKPLPERIKGGKIKKYEAIADRALNYLKSVNID